MSNIARHFVICLQADDTDDLQVRKLYEVCSDDDAARRGFLRIVDDSGEDYLYPTAWFVPVKLLKAVERALIGPVSAVAVPERPGKLRQRPALSSRR